jgi:hypothetical protein
MGEVQIEIEINNIDRIQKLFSASRDGLFILAAFCCSRVKPFTFKLVLVNIEKIHRKSITLLRLLVPPPASVVIAPQNTRNRYPYLRDIMSEDDLRFRN